MLENLAKRHPGDSSDMVPPLRKAVDMIDRGGLNPTGEQIMFAIAHLFRAAQEVRRGPLTPDEVLARLSTINVKDL